MPVSKKKRYKKMKRKSVYDKNMSRDNIFLIQFHDTKGDGKVTEYMEIPNGRLLSKTGYKIYTIHDGYSQLVSHYESPTDKTDLSCFKGKTGWYLVFVTKNEYDTFYWAKMQLREDVGTEDLFSVFPPKPCTQAEVKLLNEIYPEYLDNAF
jgi:hypothetical protein